MHEQSLSVLSSVTWIAGSAEQGDGNSEQQWVDWLID